MLSEGSVDRVYLACGPTDLRKSIDGLAALVRECFDLDPFSSSLFVFCNRQRDKVKILRWDHNGFCTTAAWSGVSSSGPQRQAIPSRSRLITASCAGSLTDWP